MLQCVHLRCIHKLTAPTGPHYRYSYIKVRLINPRTSFAGTPVCFTTTDRTIHGSMRVPISPLRNPSFSRAGLRH